MGEFTQAILLGILYWIPWTRAGYSFSHIFRQPISLSCFIGIIMGHIPEAIILGATIQLLYLVMIPAGSNIPVDEGLSACVAIPIAIQTGISPALAVMLAIPIGMTGLFLDNIRRNNNIKFAVMADQYAKEGNVRAIYFCATIYPMIFQLPIRIIPIFIAVYFGGPLVSSILIWMPTWLLHGLEIAGTILPAVGIALTLNVLGKKNLLPYFIFGFFLVKYGNLGIVSIFIMGICMAFLHLQFEYGNRGGGEA
jgi:D-glucosaminate-specific PTS system IIC component